MGVFSYVLTILGIVFWIFRSIITAMYTAGASFIIQPLNSTLEIALVFVSIPLIIFVLRRSVIGAAWYMAIYGSYFGTALYNTIKNNRGGLTASSSIDIIMSIIGVAIPVLTFMDILLNKHRKSVFSKNRKTDWFYKNEEFDRKLDERADKNQYKIR